MERPFLIGDTMVNIQVNIGVGTDRAGDESAEELLRNADLAMYTANAKGRHGCEVYAPEMHSVVLERMRTEAEVRSAFENDEFLLHYQPVVELATGAIHGVEALIRWNHPRRGLVGPTEFVPAAEATGLIVPIGEWVLRQACRDVQGWSMPRDRPPPWLSVNLSVPQLEGQDIVETVLSTLDDSGMRPNRLTLEITESVIMGDVPNVVRMLVRLRELGVKVAMDDFGTGYSSLSVLRDLPVDTLKIDRSFVIAIGQNKGSDDLVRHILQLASDVHLHTGAEGVERLDQVGVLKQLGCQSVQGFFFSKPLSSADVEALLQLDSELVVGVALRR